MSATYPALFHFTWNLVYFKIYLKKEKGKSSWFFFFWFRWSLACLPYYLSFWVSIMKWSITRCIFSLYKTLPDPLGGSLPGSSVHGISQERILERVPISSSRGSFQPRDWTHASYSSCFTSGFFAHCAIWASMLNNIIHNQTILWYWVICAKKIWSFISSMYAFEAGQPCVKSLDTGEERCFCSYPSFDDVLVAWHQASSLRFQRLHLYLKDNVYSLTQETWHFKTEAQYNPSWVSISLSKVGLRTVCLSENCRSKEFGYKITLLNFLWDFSLF